MGRAGLEPARGMLGLQPSAVAAAPPTLGVNARNRAGAARVTTSHADLYTTLTVPAEGVEPPPSWVWTRRSTAELSRLAYSRQESQESQLIAKAAYFSSKMSCISPTTAVIGIKYICPGVIMKK